MALGGFAAEMAGADEVFVYRVAPHTPPVPLEVPEQHPDGSDYAEFTCAAAMGLEVLEVLEVLEAGPARTGPARVGPRGDLVAGRPGGAP